jgi:transketolase
MRKTCLNMVHALARQDDRVVFIGSDLSPGLLAEMKAEMPARHYMEGVMEAHVIGMAAGMAMDGFLPYVNTIATFITRRCYEQVALDLCLHDLPVRLIGNGGGVVYAPLGPTHLAVEDVAIMRALPNMTVTAVSDADEMVRLMNASLEWPHPIYIRLGKGGDPIVSSDKHDFEIGKGIMLRESSATRPVLLISTGVLSARALNAAETLFQEGIETEVMHLHTLKPVDTELILDRVRRARCVCTIEEHSVVGGLGSIVLETLIEAEMFSLPPFWRLGLPDRFVDSYGVQDDLLERFGLQPDGIAQAVRDLVRIDLVA